MKKEEWRFIKDLEYYQVSNFGRVKSLERRIYSGRGGTRLTKEKILKPGLGKRGYYVVMLSCDTKTKTISVHQLVAMAFLNHTPIGMKTVVNHKDLDKLNNHVDNLEIVTQRINSNFKHVKHSSKYTGVSWYKRDSKWKAQIYIDGKSKWLGTFDDEYEAHLVYEKELKSIS